jgi:hypothetical protein
LSSYFLCKVSLCRGTAAVLLLGLCSVPVFAKSPELSAIELYTIADSRVFVGVAGFTLNAKNEVHLCSGARTISKGNYGKLPRVELAAGMSLERTNDGVLLLNRGGAPECVVPGNLKLERAGGETPSELADKAVLSGQVVSKSVNATSSIPPFARGVKIVLVAMLDTELAEFLLAQRGGDIVSWRGYLVDNPAGPHASEAKAALSILYGKDGQTALAAYQSSVNARQPNYAKLEAAKSALDYALATAVSDASTDALAQAIGQEAKSLDKEGLGEIALYQTAVAKQSTGYSHLLAAEAFLHITLNLDQKLPETISLSEACTKERTILDHRFVDFANKLSANRPDEAFEAIKPLRPFAQEFPKVQNSLDALYSYYVGLGKKDAEKGDLQGEVSEFRKAAEVKPTPEVGPMIEAAEAQAHESADRAAATTASSMSAAAEDDNDFVKAYEVLANLTPSQRKLVAERLASKPEISSAHIYPSRVLATSVVCNMRTTS